MQPRLFFGVGILDQVDLRAGADIIDLGNGDEVVDALTLVLQVEARVLKGYRELDDGLANFVDLLVGRDLLRQDSAPGDFQHLIHHTWSLLTVISSFPGAWGSTMVRE